MIYTRHWKAKSLYRYEIKCCNYRSTSEYRKDDIQQCLHEVIKRWNEGTFERVERRGYVVVQCRNGKLTPEVVYHDEIEEIGTYKDEPSVEEIKDKRSRYIDFEQE